MRGRLDALLAETEASLPDMLRKAQDPEQNANGCFTSLVSRDYEFLAVARFCAKGDVGAFFDGLRASVQTRLQLFQRHDAGEAIAGSYVTMTAGAHLLLLALAVGDRPLVDEVAGSVGGRDTLEREHDHAWDRSLGYALKAIWTGGDPAGHLHRLRRKCSKFDLGIHTILCGICQSNEQLVREGFIQALDGHRRLSSGGARWALTPSELVFLWGMGLLNLARSKGLSVKVKSDLMPPALRRPIGITTLADLRRTP
jgi:hypothetical protein